MQLYLRDQLVLLWIIFLWLCTKTTSDALPYGERIRPLKGVVKKIQVVPPCETVYNRTICKKNDNSMKIEKRIDTSITGDNIKPSITARTLVPNAKIANPLEKTQQTASPIYSGFPKENINNRGATFFFTQVEPHRYEYRAMFNHHKNNFQHTELFQPFVHHFEPFSRDFPPLPKFPTFPEFPQIFSDHKDFFPNFPEFNFPTLPPAIKRVWEPDTEVQTQRPLIDQNFDGPLVKNYDVVLGHNRYPKIFKFNEERINIEDFDREKKLRLYKLSKEGQNEIEPENVKRDQLLILHGGIFTVQEPPLFNKQVKKIRKSRLFGAKVS